MMNQNACRCCLIEHPTISYNIFDRDNLRSDLMECVPKLTIEANDGLPETICDLCWLRVREAVDFKRKCEESDRELRRTLDKDRSANVNLIDTIVDLDDVDVLLDATLELCELSPLEVSILNEVSLEDCNNPSSKNTCFQRDEDPIIIELLNAIENPVSAAPKSTSSAPPSTQTPSSKLLSNLNLANQSAVITSTTTSTSSPPKKPRRNSPAKKEQPICIYCGRKYTRNFQLKLHLNSVHNVTDGLQYKCDICEKTFASRNNLNYHKKSLHTEERNYACSQCDKRFVLSSQLVSHERMHTGNMKPRIFECVKCSKTWPSNSDLRTHMRTHDPNFERRFQCDQCEKRFYTRGHLASHLLVHSGKKPFTCALCEKSYQNVGNLNNHMVKRHSEVVNCRSRHHYSAAADQRSFTET